MLARWLFDGRRVDVATELLSAKDVPYVIAAPLLIQDLATWRREGVQGLQQVCSMRLVTRAPVSGRKSYHRSAFFNSLELGQ